MKTNLGLIWVIFFISIDLCSGQTKAPLLSNVRPASQWFRGNTHAHTVLSGHGDTRPEDVAQWYHDADYHFLVLSEHNKFIDPSKVKLPKPKRSDFILIPGIELTGLFHIHATALNVKKSLPYNYANLSRGPLLDRYLEEVQSADGEMILNHPNWFWALNADDLFYVEELKLFELYNGHPDARNDGDKKHPSTEMIWDDLLSRGKKIFGVSSDDAHYFQSWDKNLSNPGRGWIMVNASQLNPKEITEAITRGDFYSSSGVFLKELKIDNDQWVIEIDVEKTQKVIAQGRVTGRILADGKEGYTIEVIGDGGKVISIKQTTEIRHPINSQYFYQRAKITYTRKTSDGQFESFFAWANPIFSR